MVHIHTCRQNTQTHKRKINVSLKKKKLSRFLKYWNIYQLSLLLELMFSLNQQSLFLKCINFLIVWEDMSFTKCRDTLQSTNSLVILTLSIYFRNECIWHPHASLLQSQKHSVHSKFLFFHSLKGTGIMLAKGNALGPGDRLIQNQRGKPSNLASLTSKFLTAKPLKDDAYPLFKLEFYLLSTQVASEGEGQIPGNW